MRDHKKLRAFDLADDMVLEIYRLIKSFPKEETYGLTSQMRRAAVSVPINIVEGCARQSQKDYLHYLVIAFGSLRELHYQFGLAYRLEYIKLGSYSNCILKIEETEKVLNGLIRSLQNH